MAISGNVRKDSKVLMAEVEGGVCGVSVLESVRYVKILTLRTLRGLVIDESGEVPRGPEIVRAAGLDTVLVSL